MMQSSMVTNNSMMRDSAGASPVPDKERNPSMRSKALGGLLAAALSLSPAVAIGVQTAQYGIDATFIDLREGLCHELHDFIAIAAFDPL